jgi:acyl carrier protein
MVSDNARHVDIEEIERRVLVFIERELVDPGVEIQRGDDLLSGELLDSIAVLRLATFVDEEFQIGMQPSDFVIENFQTVAVLAAYVVRAGGRVHVSTEDTSREGR